jgi:uncharacterized repeat protein (TIGR03803 family)
MFLARLAARPYRASQTSLRTRRGTFRPRLEALEDRTLLSTLFVTNTRDDGSIGSLRAAITAAQTGDTIRFDPSLGGATITLKSELHLETDLTIAGLGADRLTVERLATDTNSFRLLNVGAGVNVTLSGLHLANGFDPTGGGGGVRNHGTLTINACWVDGNTSQGADGGQGTAAGDGDGGGIFNLGTLAANDSTFTGNSALGGKGGGSGGTSAAAAGGGFGGAIFNQGGMVTLSNDTFFGNTATGGTGGGDGSGGAILNSSGTVRVFNSTLAGNRSTGLAGGISNLPGGTVEVQNTIIATDLAATSPDVAGSFTSDGYNLVGDGTGSSGFTSTGDQVGTGSSPLDPKFSSSSPQYNGGPTETLGLASNSSAVAAGNPANAPVSDQNGFVRVVGGKIDIGAFQTQQNPAQPVVVSTLVLTASLVAPAAGQFYAVTATVAPLLPAAGSPVPAGSVSFNIDGGSSIAGTPLGSLAAGQWALTLRKGLGAGPHVVAAGFTPSSAYATATGTLPVTVASGSTSTPTSPILPNFGNQPDGWQPWGSLTLVGSTLYGYTAYGGAVQAESAPATPPASFPMPQAGAIFKINPDGTGYQVVHSFGGLVTGPMGSVIADGESPHHDSLRIAGNELIGATVFGGDANQGVLYAYNYVTGTYRIIHELNGFSKENPAGSSADGAQPHSNPMPSPVSPGVLYGLTSEGGSKGDGTLYQVNLDGSGFQVLRHFKKLDGQGDIDANGYDPHGFVIQIGSVLYGMTREGGIVDKKNAPDGGGVVFSFNLTSGVYTVLHAFIPKPQSHPMYDDGFGPDHGGLLLVNGYLYGLATEGGRYKDGILFRIQVSNGYYLKLHDFSGKDGIPSVVDGSGPHGSLVLGPDGVTLFGMTSKGGTADNGVVFSFNTATYKVYVLKSFQGGPQDGDDGLDNVVVYQNHLYGLTKLGGSVTTNPVPTPPAPDYAPSNTKYANGTVFSLSLVDATTTTLTSNPNPSRFGFVVNFTATVKSASPGPFPLQGMVTFWDGTRALATVPLVNGTARWGTAGLSQGTHTITATYNSFTQGGYQYTTSRGVIQQVVQALPSTASVGSGMNWIAWVLNWLLGQAFFGRPR